jgi:hypothetical protein
MNIFPSNQGRSSRNFNSSRDRSSWDTSLVSTGIQTYDEKNYEKLFLRKLVSCASASNFNGIRKNKTEETRNYDIRIPTVNIKIVRKQKIFISQIPPISLKTVKPSNIILKRSSSSQKNFLRIKKESLLKLSEKKHPIKVNKKRKLLILDNPRPILTPLNSFPL